MAQKRPRKPRGAPREPIQPLNREQKRILIWLRKVRFRRKLVGGVDERDVWKR